MKSYTDISQSKKLAEILPLESADTIWNLTNPDLPNIRAIPYESSDYNNKYLNIIPAWSLAALLGVLPQGEYKDIDLCCGGYKGDKYIPEWFCSYEQQEPIIIETCHADNPVDACVDMIVKLYELNLL